MKPARSAPILVPRSIADAPEVKAPDFAAIRRWARGLRDLRGRAPPGPESGSSLYFQRFGDRFGYLFDLSDESLRQIRHHTYHLTGDVYVAYELEADARAWRARHGYDLLVRNLPPDLCLDEPEGGIGFHYPDGRFLSLDVVRFQSIVRTLHRRGEIQRLRGLARPHILDIGCGYGGLAYQMSRILPAATFFLVDVPETLFLTAIYLALLVPAGSLYLYDPNDFGEQLAAGFPDAQFVLLPSHEAQRLKGERIDLAISIESFQEMSRDQVAQYLDLMVACLAGPLYSWNRSHSPRNAELVDFHREIESRLRVRYEADVASESPLRTLLRNAALRTGLLKRTTARSEFRRRELLAWPRP